MSNQKNHVHLMTNIPHKVLTQLSGFTEKPIDLFWEIPKVGRKSRCQTLVVEKWSDKNRKGGKSVTPFKSKIVP
jgi:hypothetical protein